MKKDWDFSREAFDRLLSWLSPNREEAGKKYEEIRVALIKIFLHRGLESAEDLADQTINRVIRKLPEIIEAYEGNPAHYFYGVARKVILEQSRKKTAPLPPMPAPAPTPEPETEEMSPPEYECLELCLGSLTEQNRNLILEYFREENGTKISKRKELTQSLNISSHTLRMRACRIKASLRTCINDCLKSKGA